MALGPGTRGTVYGAAGGGGGAGGWRAVTWPQGSWRIVVIRYDGVFGHVPVPLAAARTVARDLQRWPLPVTAGPSLLVDQLGYQVTPIGRPQPGTTLIWWPGLKTSFTLWTYQTAEDAWATAIYLADSVRPDAMRVAK